MICLLALLALLWRAVRGFRESWTVHIGYCMCCCWFEYWGCTLPFWGGYLLIYGTSYILTRLTHSSTVSVCTVRDQRWQSDYFEFRRHAQKLWGLLPHLSWFDVTLQILAASIVWEFNTFHETQNMSGPVWLEMHTQNTYRLLCLDVFNLRNFLSGLVYNCQKWLGWANELRSRFPNKDFINWLVPLVRCRGYLIG